MATKVLTTTVSEETAIWLNQESQELQITKRAIIEAALAEWRKNKIQQEIRKSYQKSHDDEEMIELAEAGLGDFLKMI